MPLDLPAASGHPDAAGKEPRASSIAVASMAPNRLFKTVKAMETIGYSLSGNCDPRKTQHMRNLAGCAWAGLAVISGRRVTCAPAVTFRTGSSARGRLHSGRVHY